MHTNTTGQPKNESISVLRSLRSLTPARTLAFAETMRIAELQANRLRQLHGLDAQVTPQEIVSELPRLQLDYDCDLPVSGSSHWNGSVWVISLNSGEPWTRQRFTLMHEFKHIVDHGQQHRLYPGADDLKGQVNQRLAEQAADYFAGCLLMPKRLLKTAWCSGMQRPSQLADHFGVSPRAVEVRLSQIGLRDDKRRCSPRRTVRSSSQTYLRTQPQFQAIGAPR